MTVEELMNLTIKLVKENIAEIEKYNKASEDVMVSMQVSKERNEILNSISSNIRILTNHNIPLLNLHHSLLEFYKKYKTCINEKENITPITESSNTSNTENENNNNNFRQECLIKTIQGIMELNSNHPLIGDAYFIDDFMKECIKREEYEKCATIKSILINKE